jgi:hypothetical protein
MGKNSEFSEFVSKITLITLASRHAATISLESSLKRADRNTYRMMTITLPICNLIHLWFYSTLLGIEAYKVLPSLWIPTENKQLWKWQKKLPQLLIFPLNNPVSKIFFLIKQIFNQFYRATFFLCESSSKCSIGIWTAKKLIYNHCFFDSHTKRPITKRPITKWPITQCPITKWPSHQTA